MTWTRSGKNAVERGVLCILSAATVRGIWTYHRHGGGVRGCGRKEENCVVCLLEHKSIQLGQVCEMEDRVGKNDMA